MNTFATYHHLRQCASARGTFTILAVDHRGNLIAEMQRARGRAVRHDEIVAFKRDVIHYLGTESTGLLTDPDYGFLALVEKGVHAGHGVLAPLEVTDYDVHPSQRATNFIENWGVEKIKKAGCSGVKLLLYYHPDAANAPNQTDLVDLIVEQCRAHDIPFYLEPISYSLDPAVSLTSPERRQVVIETAKHFTGRGVDVLKLEFPLTASETSDDGWLAALRDLDAVCTVPWTLLSGGVSFEVFLKQATMACIAGASGVMVGRAVWAEAVLLDGEARQHFLQTTGRSRMRALASICDLYGSAWMDRQSPLNLDAGWYQSLRSGPAV